jgi:hypothetical protein
MFISDFMFFREMKGYSYSKAEFREQLVLKYNHYIMEEEVLGCL